MSKRLRKVIYTLLPSLSLGLLAQNALGQQFISVAYPSASGTYPSCINNLGETVGNYADSEGVYHGFTLLNGNYSTINFPGASDTFGLCINDLGVIVGVYEQNGTVHGFSFNGASYSTIDVPGSDYTVAAGINNLGEIVGYYENAGSAVVHGFLLRSGAFTTIDFPGSYPTNYLGQINNLGAIAGTYVDSNSVSHGFVYNAGSFTPISYPKAANTGVTGINDSGELAGYYCDLTSCPVFTPGPQKWFTYNNGQFATVNVIPSAGDIFNLNLDLNNAGQLVAAYQDSAGNAHGAVSAIGPFAYVGNQTSSSCCTLTVLDTSTNLVLTTIPIPSIGGTPFAVSPDQTHIYVAAGNLVEVIDTATNSVTATVPDVGPNANAVTIAPNGNFGYTANYTPDFTSGSVSVFSTATNTVVATVPLTFPAGSVNVTPNGAYLYASGGGSTIAVINTSTNAVESTFSIPIAPGLGNGNNGPIIAPNGSVGYIGQFVASASPGTVTAIAIPSNEILATIPVGTEPVVNASSPDGAYVYVANVQSNDVSVIGTSSNVAVATVPVGSEPYTLAITPDGALAYAANFADSTLSILQNSTNSVVATIPVASPFGILIPSAPPSSQSITQPLSPTAPNTFNFGPHSFIVTYPPSTSFSGVNMTVTAAQTTQGGFKQRVRGSQFPDATCIVYSGEGGNCVDYQVTCSSEAGGEISCPSESTPTISVKTSYDTSQSIVNPGFLMAPIGTNDWTNIFVSFSLLRVDPVTKGRTTGFSEFVAVDLGATNAQGAGTLQFLPPLQQADARIFPVGTTIPVDFHLMSIAKPSVPVTDAVAGITVVMLSDAQGNPTSKVILEQPSAFTYRGGSYVFELPTAGYAPGVYALTVYGNAFAAQQVDFTLPSTTSGVHLVTTVQSLTLSGSSNQYVAVFRVANTGSNLANGVIVTNSNLNGAGTSSALPISLGDMAAGGSATVTLTYPKSAGAAGSPGVLTINESYAGGTAGGGFRVTLP
jgi:YVTN family beta-propeller protein